MRTKTCRHIILLLPIFTKDSDEVGLTKSQQKLVEKRLHQNYIDVKSIFKWYKWSKVPKYDIIKYKYKDGLIELHLNRCVTKADEEHFIEIIETGDDTWREGNIDIVDDIEIDFMLEKHL